MSLFPWVLAAYPIGYGIEGKSRRLFLLPCSRFSISLKQRCIDSLTDRWMLMNNRKNIYLACHAFVMNDMYIRINNVIFINIWDVKFDISWYTIIEVVKYYIVLYD